MKFCVIFSLKNFEVEVTKNKVNQNWSKDIINIELIFIYLNYFNLKIKVKICCSLYNSHIQLFTCQYKNKL